MSEETVILNVELDDTKLAAEQRKLEQSFGSFETKQINQLTQKIRLQERFNQLLQQQINIQNRLNAAQTVAAKTSARIAGAGNAVQRGFVGQQLGLGSAVGSAAAIRVLTAQGKQQSGGTGGITTGDIIAGGVAAGGAAGVANAALKKSTIADKFFTNTGISKLDKIKGWFSKKMPVISQGAGKIGSFAKGFGIVGAGLYTVGKVAGVGLDMFRGKSLGDAWSGAMEGTAESIYDNQGLQRSLDEDFAQKEEIFRNKQISKQNKEEQEKKQKEIDRQKKLAELSGRQETIESTIDSTVEKRQRMEKSLGYQIQYRESHRAGLMTAAAASVKGTTGESNWTSLTDVEKASLEELKKIKEAIEKL